jgi:3-methyladenine DNA glycosylase AlkD
MLERRRLRRYAAPMTSQASVPAALQWLEKQGTQANRDGMARYGIVAEKVFGVSVGTLQKYAKQVGRSHALAAGLWGSGWYEAQMLAVFVEEPEEVTAAQMERWCQGFGNWAICDTACFHLFDRTPHAWDKCESWCGKKAEFVKRTGFALLWSLSCTTRRRPMGNLRKG